MPPSAVEPAGMTGAELSAEYPPACRQLLARLCLLREELGVAAADVDSAQGAEYAETRSTHQRLLPQGAAAFIKELMAVSSAEKRCDAWRSSSAPVCLKCPQQAGKPARCIPNIHILKGRTPWLRVVKSEALTKYLNDTGRRW